MDGFLYCFGACLLGGAVCLLLNPVVMQAFRNAWYIDKLKKQKRKDMMDLMDIPEPEDEVNIDFDLDNDLPTKRK